MELRYDKTLDVALGNRRKTKTWKNKTLQWSELLSRLAKETRTSETVAEYKAMGRDQQSEIKDVGGFVGGYCNNGSRSDIRFRSVLCLDADFADDDLWPDWELLYGNAAAVYSTHKHTPEKPRLRLVVPLARNVDPEEYIAGIVNTDADNHIAQRLELVYEISTHQAVMRSAAGKVSSMQRKTDFLKEALDQAQAEYNQVCQALEESLSLMDRLKKELRRVTRARDDHTIIREAAREKLEKAKEAYEEHLEKRQVFEDKASAAEEESRKAQNALDALNDQHPPAQPRESEPEQPDWELSEALEWEEAESEEEPDLSLPPKEETEDSEFSLSGDEDFC